jgi:hypothetical protein
MVDPHGKLPTDDYAQRLDELVEAGDRAGAVKHFMTNAIGIPAPFVALMRLAPMWKHMKSTALTLPYDWAALGDHTMHGARSRAKSGPRSRSPPWWPTAPRARTTCSRAHARSPRCSPTPSCANWNTKATTSQ